jgi:NAD(P)-dependent dehydrogenase (short-subunit alcohol dehydrogenase family)
MTVETAPIGLDGKVVVVTGGTQGLGAATARMAAGRGAAGVVVVGRDDVKGEQVVGALEDETGTEALFVSVDLGDADAADRVMAAVDDRFGVVHGLVNSAAETDRGSVWDTTAALVDRLLAVNVRTPMLLMQGAARLMKREGVGGSIVNIGSVAGYGGEVFLLPYATSKGALHAMTRNAAYALMRDRIRVNLLNPGWMDTPAEDAIQRRYHGAGDGWLEEAEARQPFGRLLKPEEVARGICFLLSDESGMMTGACLDFDQSVIGAGSSPRATPLDVWGEEALQDVLKAKP